MFIFTIYDSDHCIVENYPNLISVVSQANNTICFSYLAPDGSIVTEEYKLDNGESCSIRRY